MTQSIGQSCVVIMSPQELENLLLRTIAMAINGYQNRQSMNAEILSPRQVARLAKIRDERVYQAIESGQLSVTKTTSGHFLINRAAAVAWIDALSKFR
jgi:excisionase family DNA binding protein